MVFAVYYLFTCCCKRDLHSKELLFMCYSGQLKGAICFGLMIEMSEYGVWCDYDPAKAYAAGTTYYPADISCTRESVIHNSVLTICVLTTIIFGTFMGPVRKCLLGHHGERKSIEIKQKL